MQESTQSHLIIFNCLQRNAFEQTAAPPILDNRVVVKSRLDFLFAAAHLIHDAAVELLGKVAYQFIDNPFAESTDHQDRSVVI